MKHRAGTGSWLAALLVVALSACAGSGPPRAASAPAARQLAENLSGFMWPLPLELTRELTSAYGVRGRRHHDGVDLRSRQGDAIFAAREGVVRFAGSRRGYGLTVILDHGGGVTTLYAHASQLHVRTGERVERGQVIAAVGATGNATGPHLHFEVAWAGVPIDPVLLLPRLASR